MKLWPVKSVMLMFEVWAYSSHRSHNKAQLQLQWGLAGMKVRPGPWRKLGIGVCSVRDARPNYLEQSDKHCGWQMDGVLHLVLHLVPKDLSSNTTWFSGSLRHCHREIWHQSFPSRHSPDGRLTPCVLLKRCHSIFLSRNCMEISLSECLQYDIDVIHHYPTCTYTVYKPHWSFHLSSYIYCSARS